MSEECIDDQMPMGEDIDKVVDEMVGGQDAGGLGGAQPQSPQSAAASGHLGAANASKQVFLHRCFV